jgi:predicted phosphate transport protein (TIGR00153 family)
MGALVDLGFLSTNRREREVFNGVLQLLNTVGATVDSFVQSVVAMGNGDVEAARGSVSEVIEGETNADEIHRDLSLKIAEGAFFGGVREDILNLLEKIDNIADSAKDAARFLAADSLLGPEAREKMASNDMQLFLGALKSSVSALTTLVKALEDGKKEALAKVQTVEEFEELADAHKDAMIKSLFSDGRQINPVTVIQLRDFIFVADDVADNAEDASDVILVLVAKGYG